MASLERVDFDSAGPRWGLDRIRPRISISPSHASRQSHDCLRSEGRWAQLAGTDLMNL